MSLMEYTEWLIEGYYNEKYGSFFHFSYVSCVEEIVWQLAGSICGKYWAEATRGYTHAIFSHAHSWVQVKTLQMI